MGSTVSVKNKPDIQKNIARATQTIKKIIQGEIDSHFEKEGDSQGKKWAPLSDPFATGKKTTNHKILNGTGKLRNSIKIDVELTEDKMNFHVYTDVEYALFHELGTKNIPKRSFMQISDSALKQIENILGSIV